MAMPENGIEVTSHQSPVTSHSRLRISNFSFKRSFQTESKGSTPPGLTPNLEPRTPNYAIIEARTPTYFLKER